MLKLYQLPGPWDICSASPFCAKLEAFMRWQKIPFQTITVRSLKGAPKGQVPYIDYKNGGGQTTRMGDSNLIIDFLIKKHDINPDATLTPEQKAVSLALRTLCEDTLYRVMSYFRWVDSQGWKVTKKQFFSKLSPIIGPIIAWRVRKYAMHQLRMHGIARNSHDEVVNIACENLEALSTFLADKTYFFGDTMTILDVVVFSIFSNYLAGAYENPVFSYAKSIENLMEHTNRVRAQCFSNSLISSNYKVA